MAIAYAAQNRASAFNAFYERPATIGLIEDVQGLRVLEAGSGPGVLTEWLVDHGAVVTAMDVSPKMVQLARNRVGDRARIVLADLAEPLDFMPDASVDLVVASLVLHYVADWAAVLREFHRVLVPDGTVVFSTHHPAMDWQLHSRDNYFAIKRVTETWDMPEGSHEVTFWRRPLTAMTAAIADADFVIEQLIEPEPVPELRRRDAEADTRLRTSPAFLFFRLVKKGATRQVRFS